MSDSGSEFDATGKCDAKIERTVENGKGMSSTPAADPFANKFQVMSLSDAPAALHDQRNHGRSTDGSDPSMVHIEGETDCFSLLSTCEQSESVLDTILQSAEAP